jgi:hypothetical protein
MSAGSRLVNGYEFAYDFKERGPFLERDRQVHQQAVSCALEISDEYVWIYSPGPRFSPPIGVESSFIDAITAARHRIKR